MQIPRISPENAKGLVDKAVGLGREVAGTVLGKSNLKEAGQKQQAAGTEKLQAIEEEAKAKTHEAKSASAEKTQRSVQQSKN